MAKNTSKNLRHLHIYSIFVRNFSSEGNFNGVIKQLDRLKKLDIDAIWLLPFYPNGEQNKKGTIGSPYAIKDYRSIDPKQGDLLSFKRLIEEAHQRDIKVMIDIVFNHTSPDSVLASEHPEWFYHTSTGEFGNRVGDWSDIIDLEYDNKELWDYQIETLKYWAQWVDGFRVDVAPLVPLAFWEEARAQVEMINPEMIWLAESVEPHFIKELRANDLVAHSDGELYNVFDLTYDYDVRVAFEDYLNGEIPLSEYIRILNNQDTLYPENYVKLRNLENHDRKRFTNFVSDKKLIVEWLAFNYFQKGAALIYNGQEVLSKKTPSLFDEDPIDWETENDISAYIAQLSQLKREYIPIENVIYSLKADDDAQIIVGKYEQSEHTVYGVFDVAHRVSEVPVPIEDGTYYNLLNEEIVVVKDGVIPSGSTPCWITKK